MSKSVVLVDENDNEVGADDKLNAHLRGGRLHRAFSIFIFNPEGRMLLHKRHRGKYHSGGLWTNACCSHPAPGESLERAAHRRLNEEMGFDCDLREVFSFVYKADGGKGVTEHEFDHVFVGEYDGSDGGIKPDSREVSEWKWIDLKDLKDDVTKHPEKYTPWFKIAIDKVISHHTK
jgi:isopentenyl-diphosphate delta-isomerase